MLTKLTTQLPLTPLECWRSELLIDIDDPMSIKRPEPKRKRRVAFHDIYMDINDVAPTANKKARGRACNV